MKKILNLFVFVSICFFNNLKGQEKFQHEGLITIWETKKDLKTTESVIYDKENDLLYVSNVNQNPWEKDKNGYISKLNLKGDIVDTKWVKDLSAPKGMGIYKGKLYVADVDELVEIDIKKGEIINRYHVDGAQKLNDITISSNGAVYISDSGDAAIYNFKKGKVEFFTKSQNLKGINGIYAQGNLLYAGLENKVISIDISTKAVKTFTDNTGGVDGLVPSGKNSFFISDWSGHIYEIKEGEKPTLMLDTTPLQINAADIEYIKDKAILLVPTFYKDNVVAYQVRASK
jgi:hypothetical protein